MNKDRDEQGSAIAEFILIATPLFLPALFFFSAMQESAKVEMTVSQMARQSLRAFITSENLEQGHQRVRFILDSYSQLENKGSPSEMERKGFTYNIRCANQGCLTPGSLIELSLYRTFHLNNYEFNQSLKEENRKAAAVVSGYVDKWRDES